MANDKKADKGKGQADEAEGAEGQDNDKPKSRFAALLNRKVLMIAAPVLLLLVGGAAYFLLFSGGEEPVAEDGQVAEGAEGKAHAAAEEPHPVFFEVPDIRSQLLQSKRPVILPNLHLERHDVRTTGATA